MSVQQWARSAAMARLRPSFRHLRAAVAVTLAALAVGCSVPPPVLAERDPSDPGAKAPPVAYRSAIEPYTPQRPVGPAPWQEQNQRITPAPRP
jgi:hypothetical protein